MNFDIPQLNTTISAPKELRPLVFITSNSERRLPEPFLRRCVFHHIKFDAKILEQAVAERREEFSSLSSEFIKHAMERFLKLRDRKLRKSPSTSEFLVWLRVLSITSSDQLDSIAGELGDLPHLGLLIKDHLDMEELTQKK